MLTTIQDLGRWGYQSRGVPVAGPMDTYSHMLANRLVGNDAGAAALEITLMGPEIESDADITCAVAGATFRITVGGHAVPLQEPFVLPAKVPLRFGERMAGARASLAVRGGFDVEPLFGSRATSLISRMGPFEGRALRSGDRLPVGSSDQRHGHASFAAPEPARLPAGGAVVRVMRGPQDEYFTTRAFDTLFSARFAISTQSNRMGYRLEGPALQHKGKADILSDATPIGTMQVPASGQPILLMADRQTTGGYPKIATVITADLPLAGQLAPGDWIEFKPATRAEALDALRLRYRRLEGVRR
jgi:antagonist of KipI